VLKITPSTVKQFHLFYISLNKLCEIKIFQDMKQKWVAIANPAAAGGKAKNTWPEVRQTLVEFGISHKWIPTEAPGDAVKIVREAIENGHRHFISIGGDGTHHEVVNGFCKSGIQLSDLTLGLMPIGTGNDWAKTLEVPQNIQEAGRIIDEQQTRAHHVGRIDFDDDREAFFMNVAGMCMDAAVVQNVPPGLVKKIGGLAYLLGGIRELITYRSPKAYIEIGDYTFTDKYLTIHAGFGKYCGGGMEFLPHAILSSDTMAITTISAKNKWKLLLNIHKLFRGSIHSLDAAHAYSSSKLRVQHTDKSKIPIEADGEFLGYSPFEISVLPHAIKVCAP
jgi:YegS/Rv2252/BmrU family lipid kinase